MFVALELARRPDGAWWRLREILGGKPRPLLEERALFGARYAVLRARGGRDGPDWDEVVWAAREYARWILLPDGVQLPQGSPLRAYVPDAFDREVLLRTACRLIAATRMPMYKRVLGIIDEHGRHTGMLPELLRHYTSVKALTRNAARYEQAAERMMYELGAPVLQVEGLSGFSDCALVLAPEAYSSQEDARLKCPVLAAKPVKLRYRTDVVDRLCVSLPDTQAGDALPEGIDTHLLAGALYELCGVRAFEPAAASLCINGRHARASEAARLILEASGLRPGDLCGN